MNYQKFKFMLNKKNLAIFLFATWFLIVLATPNIGVCAVSIEPSSGDFIVDTPVEFTVTGLNASRTYSVKVDGSVEQSGLSPDNNGQLKFRITFSTTGNHKVEVVDDVSGSVVATANIYVYDIVDEIMPWLVIMILITVLFGVFGEIKKELR